MFKHPTNPIQLTVDKALLPHLARHLQRKFMVTALDPETTVAFLGGVPK